MSTVLPAPRRVDLDRLRLSPELELLEPGDLGFDRARSAWNTAYEHDPIAVVRPISSLGVAQAVTFAHEHGSSVAIQSTGHGPTRTADGSILLDLSRLDRVSVDADRRRATVGGGARWQAVLEATVPFGLAPLLGSTPDVGAVGYTLGGGIGWLTRKYGTAADSTVRFELVTADGRTVQVTVAEEPELLWALRGAGAGHLGVVTEMEIELFPVRELYGGNLFYPAELAPEVMRRWRDWVGDLSEDMTSAVTLMNFPPVEDVPDALRGQSVVIVRGAHVGTAQAAEAALAYWRDWRAPTLDLFGAMPFSRIAEVSQDPTDPLPFAGTGLWMRALGDASIDELISATFPADGPPLFTFSEIRHTATSRPGPGDGLCALTQAGAALMLAMVAVTPTAEATAAAESEMQRLQVSLGRDLTGRRYLNFIEGARRRDGLERAFGADAVGRLAAVKARIDPDGLFDRGLDTATSSGAPQ